MDVAIVVILLLVGIVLFLAEVFLLPGVTFAAVGGGLFCVGGIVYGYLRLGVMGGSIALVCASLVFLVVFVWLVKSKALDRVALKTEINSTVADGYVAGLINIGDTGISISRLNPMGKVKVNQLIVEAKTLEGFVDEGVEVIVLEVNPTQILVETKYKNIN